MKDYKTHLDNFVADLYKRIDEEDKKRDTINIIRQEYIELNKKLAELIESISLLNSTGKINFIDNAQFIDLMGISQKTAQSWRDNGLVSFSQINNKIFYQISDIQDLLDRNYHKSTNQLSK